MHRVMVQTIPADAGATLVVEGEEAHHALRVKRVRAGEHVEAMDGRGGIAACTVVDQAVETAQGGGHRSGRKERDAPLVLRVESIRRGAPVVPRVEVWSAAPKGARLEEMIDQLAQAGAGAWRPLETARGVVDPREHKLERMHRVAREASKQCGRAWTMEIGTRATLEEALHADEQTRVIVADASGKPWCAPSSVGTIRLLVGPEGGWTGEELARARSLGCEVVVFGPHAMRIETAAVVACGVMMAGAAEKVLSP